MIVEYNILKFSHSVILCMEDVQPWEKEKLEVDEHFRKDENLPKLFIVFSLLLFALVKLSTKVKY